MQSKDPSSLEKKLERLAAENRSLKQRLVDVHKENSDLRRSLIKKDGLLNSLPAGVVVIAQNKIREINKKALDTLGYTKEELLGRDFLDLVHPDSKARIRALHQKRIEGKPAPSRYEADMVTKDGRTVSCDVGVEKVMWAGRQAFLARLTGMEVRKTRERELIRTQKQEVITTMASGLLRHLRPAAQVITEYLRRVQTRKGGVAPFPGGGIASISHAARRLEELAEVLESLSSGGYESGRAIPFDIREVVQEAISHREGAVKEKASREGVLINLKSYLRPVSPIEGDPNEFRDVMVRLIDNGVSAMPRGGDLHISVEENAGSTYVYVQDSGIGIPDEIKGRIADPFFTTKGKDAEGLGLSLASAVVKRHQGELEIESKRDQGTTVTIRMPAAKGGRQEKARLSRRSLKSVRILILEEDHMIRELFSQVLLSKGYRISTAEDIPGGLEKLKAKPFDLVLAGDGTGGIRGMNLVRRIRRVAPETRLALIVEQGNEDFPRVHPKARVDLLIGKPIDMTGAVNQISEILGGNRMR